MKHKTLLFLSTVACILASCISAWSPSTMLSVSKRIVLQKAQRPTLWTPHFCQAFETSTISTPPPPSPPRTAATRLFRSSQIRHTTLALYMLPSSNERFDSRTHQCTTTTTTTTRLFGTKPGPDSPQGQVFFDDDQQALKVDTDRLIKTVADIRKLLGYETYDVSLLLVDDAEMQDTNQQTRNVNAPTDILSFPFHQAESAGTLMDPDFDIPDYYTLGDMMLDVPYVIRRCKEDQEDEENGVVVDDDDDDEVERGVSGAMAKVYNPEDRINMLIVHGMLHLVGHDHEDDDEYEAMVSKEEEILAKLGMLPETTAYQ